MNSLDLGDSLDVSSLFSGCVGYTETEEVPAETVNLNLNLLEY